MEKIDIKSLTLIQLSELLESLKEPSFRAIQLFEWIHKKLALGFEEMTNLPKTLRENLEKCCEYTTLKTVQELHSKNDDTCKYLFQLSDGNIIESVRMSYHHGDSVCISSQVGCRMGCRFCASTLDGLTRNLTPSEMLEEIYQIERITQKRLNNVVIMGTGEPLDNYENLVQFLHLLFEERGQNFSQRSVTISTCGLVEQIKRFAQEDFNITLALSLHAPTDALRSQLMPIANRYPLSEVIKACDYYYERTGRRVSYEYSLIDGVNDTPLIAKQLVQLLRGKNCHVNLIPINPVKERGFIPPRGNNTQRFKNILEKNKINVTIRREMGADIDAACGQLRKRYMEQAIKKKGGEL